jgi:hypothetical protein
MTPGRLKLASIAGLAVVAGLVLLAGSQPWAVEAETEAVRDAPTAILAVGLAQLALVGALAIAGPVFRIVLGVLAALLGLCVVLVVVVTGEWSTAWPALAVAGGTLFILGGLFVAITARAWPAGGRKYSRTRLAGGGAVADWDALSEGEDPTEDRPEPSPPAD